MRWIEHLRCHRSHLHRPLTHPRVIPDALIGLCFALLLGALLPAAIAVPALARAAPSSSSTAAVGLVQIVVEDGGAVDAKSIIQQYGPSIKTAVSESAMLFGIPADHAVTITFVTSADPSVTAGMRPIRDIGWERVDGTQAIVLKNRFDRLTSAQAENLFRNIVSRPSMQAAANGNLPAGLMDGIARYFERPILADQAHSGALVQAASQNGILPDFAPLVNLGANGLDFETATATRYALVAFIVNRYGIGSLQHLVQSFATSPVDWESSFSTTLYQPLDQLQAAWRDFLPRWFASGWQTNAIDSFDLAAAQALFDRGAYAAAADRAALSQKLFSELGGDQQLARIETLLALCAVGIQSETLMTETQQALTNHDYLRAQSLLADVDQQYSLLPDEHRPAETLNAYHQTTSDGLGAMTQLNQATHSSDDWLKLRSSRSDALAAGSTFARLGDTDRAATARLLLATIDSRVHRLALILATLGILITTWFGIWIWSRAPLRFAWPRVHTNRKGAARWSIRS